MTDEQTQSTFNREQVALYGLDWRSLLDRDGMELEALFIDIFNGLCKQLEMPRVIFRKVKIVSKTRPKCAASSWNFSTRSGG